MNAFSTKIADIFVSRNTAKLASLAPRLRKPNTSDKRLEMFSDNLHPVTSFGWTYDSTPVADGLSAELQWFERNSVAPFWFAIFARWLKVK